MSSTTLPRRWRPRCRTVGLTTSASGRTGPPASPLGHRRLEVVGEGPGPPADGALRVGPELQRRAVHTRAPVRTGCSGRRHRAGHIGHRGTGEGLATVGARETLERWKACSPSPPGTLAPGPPSGPRPFRREAVVLRLGRTAASPSPRSSRRFTPSTGFGPRVDRCRGRLPPDFLRPGAVLHLRGIRQVGPGLPGYRRRRLPPAAMPEQRPYWSAIKRSARPGACRRCRTIAKAVDTVEAVLSRAVAARMVADVPVGALLSGGIDSSLIVALMQRHSALPVRTFTVAFSRAVVRRICCWPPPWRSISGPSTRRWRCPPRGAGRRAQLAEIWDEPFSDSSQLPTHLVAAVARRT